MESGSNVTKTDVITDVSKQKLLTRNNNYEFKINSSFNNWKFKFNETQFLIAISG